MKTSHCPLPATLITLIVCASCAVTGCRPQASTGSSTYSGKFGDLPIETTVRCQSWNDRIVFMLWTDYGGVSHGSGSTSPIGAEWSGTFGPRDGAPQIKWSFNTTDGKSGAITINDAEYDFSDGTILLVSVKDEKPVIKQWKRDTSQISPDRQSIDTLAKDPEIKVFFTKEETTNE